MELLARAAREGVPPDIDQLIAAVPYCAWLGLAARIEAERVVLEMPFDAKLIGNPIIPALHGGVIGSLLETAAIVQSIFATQSASIPKPVDITIDYLRAGKPMLSHARAELVRVGRRVISARAEMWQDDAAKPVASFRGHFLLG